MAFTATKLPFFGSIETLLADVQSVTSSELSLKQLAALIEDEFHCHMERHHMEKKNDSQNFAFGKVSIASVKSKALSVSLSAMKWMTGIFFILLLALILAPERTADSLNALPYISSRESPESLRYSLSDIDWYFYALQLLRRGSTILRLERKFPVTSQDLDGCILNNPLFVAEKVNCSSCRKVSGFNFRRGDYSFNQPTVVIEGPDLTFSLGRLQQVLRKNEVMVNQHTTSIITNCDYIHTVEDLKSNHVLEQLENDNVSHIAVTAVTYMSSHIWRKEFPRPQDYITHAAETSKNYFYIDGKNSPTFQLESSIWESNFMYIQGSGSRRLVFSPPHHCNDKCKTFSRVMKTGDIVFYPSIWTIHSEPTKHKSIAYVDNFERM